MVPKAETTLVRFVFFANASAPDDVCAINQGGVVRVHRQRTGDQYLSRDVPGLSQHVVEARPVDGQEQHVGIFGGLARRAGPCAAAGLTGEPIQLPLTAGVAKDDVVPGFREDRSELSAH
jgi:hypothetical protein